MKKNDVFTVTIEDMGEDGAGIGKTDGYTWFIKDALIGDVIQASVMKMKKNYGFARLVKILEPAPARVEPRCPVARACGGCQLQELDYREQLRFKERKVYNHLKRIGGMDRLFLPEDREKAAGVLDAVVMEPIIGMEDPWRYRNKAQYPVGLGKDGQLTAGFYAGRTHSLIPAPGLDCLLGCQENKELLKIILDFMKEYKIKPYDEAAHQGLVRHVLLRKGFSSGGLMVCLVINGEELPHGGELAERLREAGVSSVSYSVNTERTNVIMGTRIVNLYGPGYITDTIGDIEYRISPLSFYQVNPVQTEILYKKAVEFAGLTGKEKVIDAYCGIGTIGMIASDKAKEVIGVELNKDAVRDARINARENKVVNISFRQGDAGEFMEAMAAADEKADVVFMDPPRSGSSEKFLNSVTRLAPKKIVYISCNPETLARDLLFLTKKNYVVKEIQPVEMFCFTDHTEVVTWLEKAAR